MAGSGIGNILRDHLWGVVALLVPEGKHDSIGFGADRRLVDHGVSSVLKAFGIRRTTILENNIVQTAGSAGESLAFGVGATMPALFLLGFKWIRFA